MPPHRRHIPHRAAGLLLLAALIVACGTRLPSARPLGAGPLSAERLGLSQEEPRVTRPAPPPAEAPAASEASAALVTDAGAGPEPEALPKPDAEVALPAIDDAGNNESTSTATFAGEYRGNDRAVVRMPGQAPSTENDPKARITVAEQGKNQIALTLIDSSNGTPICTLAAKAAGSTATITPGQPCFGSGSPNLASSLKSGSARVDGKRLTVEFQIELRFDAAGQQALGSIEYHFEGDRS